MTEPEFRALIERTLRAQGMSAITAALAAGLKRDTIRSVLRGRSPSLGRVVAICEALGLELRIGRPGEALQQELEHLTGHARIVPAGRVQPWTTCCRFGNGESRAAGGRRDRVSTNREGSCPGGFRRFGRVLRGGRERVDGAGAHLARRLLSDLTHGERRASMPGLAQEQGRRRDHRLVGASGARSLRVRWLGPTKPGRGHVSEDPRPRAGSARRSSTAARSLRSIKARLRRHEPRRKPRIGRLVDLPVYSDGWRHGLDVREMPTAALLERGDEDQGEQHKLQARLQTIASTTGSARTWASAWWLSTTGRWTVCRAASRGAGNRGQTEPARRSGVPPRGYADRLPTTGDRLRHGATVAGATQRLTKPKRRQQVGDEREGELGATRFHGRLNAREAAERAAGAPRGMRRGRRRGTLCRPLRSCLHRGRQ